MCGGGLGVGVNLHSCAGVRPSGSYQLAARAATASDSRACGRLVEPELALVRRILHDIEAEAAWLGARALGIRLHDVLPGWRKRDDATVGWMALRRDWACHELAEPLRLHFHLDEDRDHLRHASSEAGLAAAAGGGGGGGGSTPERRNGVEAAAREVGDGGSATTLLSLQLSCRVLLHLLRVGAPTAPRPWPQRGQHCEPLEPAGEGGGEAAAAGTPPASAEAAALSGLARHHHHLRACASPHRGAAASQKGARA